jgi:hypothetical protein
MTRQNLPGGAVSPQQRLGSRNTRSIIYPAKTDH